MEITWIGQGGFLLVTDNLKIVVDPYLSNAIEKNNPHNYRRIPINHEILNVRPDVLIFTHSHADHYDPETVRVYLQSRENILVLAPSSVWGDIRKFGGTHNYVLFNCYTQWTEKDVRFLAVKAEHSDESAIGVVIDNGHRIYYITGDTLYNEAVFRSLPEKVDVLFLPVNGQGNNMNMNDAKRFAERVKAETVVPMHCGMFDNIDMEAFQCNNKCVLAVYQKMLL